VATVEVLLVILLLVSFVPPIFYVSWVRRAASYQRVSGGAVAKGFLFGAIVGVIVAVILSLILIVLYEQQQATIYQKLGFTNSLPELIVLGCIIAPLAEESAKLLGVYFLRSNLGQRGDGFVVGASVGLGFAATENALYGLAAYLTGGFGALIVVAVLRALTSALLHGSATAISGHGYALHHLHGQSRWLVLNYFVAVVLHGFFNLMASLGTLYENTPYGTALFLGGLLVILVVAWGTIRYVRSAVAEADLANAVALQQQKKRGGRAA
jgi:RsiW-degrading membrane proteinase PrsW (M82 family)